MTTRLDSGRPTGGILPGGRLPLVGRAEELRTLAAALDAACAGRTAVALVGGDPGIGKSRLIAELVEVARSRGVVVLTGRGLGDEGAPPLWPWTQALRQLVAPLDRATVAADLGPAAAVVAQVVPAVAEQLPDLPDPAPLGPAPARFRLVEALCGFVARAAHRRPLLVVLEDLHWADPSTLQLLEFIAAEVREAPLLVVATYREIEVRKGDPLEGTVTTLAVHEHVRRLHLGGLSVEEVGHYVAALLGEAPGRALAQALTERTDGNPFFVGEVVRLLARDGGFDPTSEQLEVRVPAEVRTAIERRLERLGPVARDVLGAAAICGREVDTAVLDRVLQIGMEPLLGALDEAVRHRLLVSQGAGVHVFAHALVRETLLDGLDALRRARLHEQVGAALVALRVGGPEASPAELAHHFVEAAVLGGDEAIDRAVSHSLAAAREATRRLAFEDAVAHHAVALRLAIRGGYAEEQQGRLFLALGEAQNRAGDTQLGRASLLAVIEIARRLGDAPLLGRAVLGYRLGSGTGFEFSLPDPTLVPLLEEALAALGAAETPLRAGLLARLAMELSFSEDVERRNRLGAEAVATARVAGDERVLVEALIAAHIALWSPFRVVEQVHAAREAVRRAVALGDRELELQGRYWMCGDLLVLGDIVALDAELASVARLAQELRQPIYLWWARLRAAMRHLMDGRLDDAERIAGEALAMGTPIKETNAVQVYAAQLMLIRWEQGRLAELHQLLADNAHRFPRATAWSCAQAFVAAGAGFLDMARAQLAELVPDGRVDIPHNYVWLAAVTELAEVAIAVDDRAAAEAIYAALLPLDGRWVSVGPATLCIGPVGRLLGELAVLLGDHEAAEGHLDSARAAALAAGSRPWVAHVDVARARLHADRGLPGDAERAQAAARSARATALAIGHTALARRAEQVAEAVDGGAVLTRREREVLELARSGATARDIGARLFIGERTVETHLASIYRKLGVRSRLELIGRAPELG